MASPSFSSFGFCGLGLKASGETYVPLDARFLCLGGFAMLVAMGLGGHLTPTPKSRRSEPDNP